MRPTSLDELAEFVRSAERIETLPWQPNAIDLSQISGIEELRKEDMVVKVRAGTTLADLQGELAGHDLALPVSTAASWHAGPCTQLHEFLNLNFPHVLMAQHGSWRDWVIGATFVIGDGSICKSGSSVVKSVAGFDVHKFLIGSLGEFAIWGSLTMRIVSLNAIKPAHIVGHFDANIEFVQRVQSQDFENAKSSAIAYDDEAHTLWHTAKPQRFLGDFVVDRCGRSLDALPHQDLLIRAKQQFDPTGKFVGGLLGSEK